MPTLQIEHSSEHSQAFQDLTNSDSPVPGNIATQPPLGDPALGHAMQYSSLRSGSKRPVDRPSSSKYQSAWSATKGQFSSHWSTDQYTVNIHTGTGTR